MMTTSTWTMESFPSDEALAIRVAQQFVDLSGQRTRPWFTALSGGRIARRFFEAVCMTASAQSSRLSPVRFFWADERCVPPDHPDSNYALAKRHLLEPAKIAEDHIHRVRGELGADAANQAEADLLACIPADDSGVPVFDLVLLGMGEDGHVASLFPGNNLWLDSRQNYHAVIGPKPPPLRITLGLSALIRARVVWVLVSGPGKSEALQSSLSPTGQSPLAQLLQHRTKTHLFVSR
jgi:6-phosphogluconolactonase